jgi:hypothetical protein
VPPSSGTSFPLCTLPIYLMIDGAVASLPAWGSLHLFTGPTSKWLFVPGLPSGSPEIAQVGTLATLEPHNLTIKPQIEMWSKTKL